MAARFVTKEDMERLGLAEMIGSKAVRAYMHGFFLPDRLWRAARERSQPFDYEEYRKRAVEEKLAAQRANRITLLKKLPKVGSPGVPRGTPPPPLSDLPELPVLLTESCGNCPSSTLQTRGNCPSSTLHPAGTARPPLSNLPAAPPSH